MNDEKKSIIINANYLHSSKQKKEKPKSNNLMKGISMKNKLLQKVKQHHKNTIKDFTKNQNAYPSKQTEINSFDESLNYLDSVLKKQKQKKREIETKEKENERQTQKQQTQFPYQEIILPKNPTSATIALYNPNDNVRKTTSFTLNNEPPYGILKRGKKPTYRQYNTSLKSIHGGEKNTQSITIENNVHPIEPFSNERKDKLKSYIKNYNITNKQNKNKKKIYIREKTIKTTRRLGKKNNKVGVLVKSDKTRRRIKHELDILKQVSLNVVKNYLKKRDLIKAGTNAPEYVLRQIYEDSILSGDIYNKNSDVFIHNYFNEKIEL